MCACVCVCVDWCLKSTPPWKFTFSRRVSMNTELVVYFVSSWHERPAFCFLLIDFALRALCTCCWILSSFPPNFFFFLSLSISNTQDVHSLALFYLSSFFFFLMVFFVLYFRMGRGFRFSFKSKRPNLFEFRIGKVTPLLNPSQVFFSKILGHLSPSLCVCVLDLIYLLTIIQFFFFFFRTGTRFFFFGICLSLSLTWSLISFYWQNALVPATRVPKTKLNV